jgi:bifunctional DNA-binding transcriptional regulator/antitoxin component of YhaV-PrlF toxin-antitoxin module
LLQKKLESGKIRDMEIYTQIKQKGIITIPIKLRKQIGLIDNDLLRMKIVNNSIMLEPVRVLPYKTRSYNSGDVLDFLELDKNEVQNSN